MSERERISNRSRWYSTIGLFGTGVVAGAFASFFFGEMVAIVLAMLAMAAIMICAFGKIRSDEALRQLTEQPNDPRP